MNLEQNVKSFIKNNPDTFKKNKNWSDDCKGVKNAFYGKKHTRESIDRQIIAQTGQPHHSEEYKKKLSVRLTKHNIGGSGKDNGFYGKKHTEETRRRISESLKGNTNKRKNK